MQRLAVRPPIARPPARPRCGARRAALLALISAMVACSGERRSTTPSRAEVPPRAPTGGEALLPLLPPGAELVLEVDLQRARQHPALGPLLAAALKPRSASTAAAAQALPQLAELAPLSVGRAVVIASYRIGTAQAQSLTLVALDEGDAATGAGDVVGALGATRLRPGVLAFGPPELIAGAGSAAAPAPALLRLRARAMPAAAEGALLRLTADLSFDARVALARQLELDPPPARLSVWLDVLDDAALVVLADSAEPEPRVARRLEAALRGALGAVAAQPAVRLLGLAPAVRAAAVQRDGSWVRAAVVLGPQRLRRVTERLSAWVTATPASVSSSLETP